MPVRKRPLTVAPVTFEPTDYRAISRLLRLHEAEVMAVMEPLGYALFDAHSWLYEDTANDDHVARLYGVTSAMSDQDSLLVAEFLCRSIFVEHGLADIETALDVVKKLSVEVAEREANGGVVIAPTAPVMKRVVWKVESYNALRFSRPWLATITDWPIGKAPVLEFGHSLDLRTVEIAAAVSEVIKFGQKDNRGNKGTNLFGLVDEDGDFGMISAEEARARWVRRGDAKG